MKQIQLILSLLVGFAIASPAQVKKKIETVTIQTPGVQCEQCKNRVESTMAREEGVARTVADYRRKTTKVTYYTDRTNIENIKTAIANAGYDADDVTANPDSYKKLPVTCQKHVAAGAIPKK